MAAEIKTIDLGGVNCYLVNTGNGFILVDTGGGTAFDQDTVAIRNRLEKALDVAGCKPGNLKLILITHGDADHIENSEYIREKYKAPVAVHKGDKEMVENPDMKKYLRDIRFRNVYIKILFKLVMLFMKLGAMKKMETVKGFKPDLYIDEGFDLAQYGLDAKILHLPGHTKGSIGILTSTNDLICGDILANKKKPDIAMNAFDFDELYASVARIKELNIRTVYPGHGTPFPMEALVKLHKF